MTSDRPVPHDADRYADAGELCTCGRQAHVVFTTDKFGDVGYCGRADNPTPILPCPFCGDTDGHGEDRCPNYRISPKEND